MIEMSKVKPSKKHKIMIVEIIKSDSFLTEKK